MSRLIIYRCANALKNRTFISAINQRAYSSTFKDPKTFSTSSVMNQPRSLAKLKKLQQDFQCEDGRPVWLKMGFCDRVLYTTTIISCYAGVFMVLVLVYNHAKPESWKKGSPC